MKIIILTLVFALFLSCTAEQKKASYSTSEIVLSTSTGDIYGSLTIPEKEKPIPLVIIIPGSGAPDRDGNMAPMLQTNMYKMLADKLAENGISSLRYDKRGIAKSKDAMESESKLRFETYASDVVEWVSLLKKDNRFSKIILLGHSEGSLLGILAAEKSNVSSFISIAGAGKSIDKILKDQLISLPSNLLIESNKIIDSLSVGKMISEVNPNLNTIFRPSVQPYLISWMKYDPAIEIAKLDIPILIIQGNTDLQVSVNDAQMLHQAKPDAELVIIDQMNHVLKASSSDLQENKATYSNPKRPLKQTLITTIIEFLKDK